MGDFIWFDYELEPGSGYRLYLNNSGITSKQVFLDDKNQALQIASVRGFNNFSVDIPNGASVDDYSV